jgi:hypothetical protein
MSEKPLPNTLNRRGLIKAIGAGTVAATTGCLGGGSDEGQEGDGTGGMNESDGETDNGDSETVSYGWQDATWDSYNFSLYNMNNNIAMSGNGVRFPHNEQQRNAQNERMPAILEAAEVDQPPVRNPWLNMAPFTEGEPSFTQEPDLGGPESRPDGSTMRWDPDGSSQTVSPSSLAWSHLKGITWAKNFQAHSDILPGDVAPLFRAQLLSTMAQIGINASLIQGGPQGNGALTKGETLELVSEFTPPPGVYNDDTIYSPPENPGYADRTTRPHHHAAMLWFLSEMNSFAQNGWFGYENPEPLIPAERIQGLTDGVAEATMSTFSASDIVSMESTRSVGLLLGAVGYYAPQAGSEEERNAAVGYANELAGVVEDNLAGNGMVENGAANQAATQGVVGQGLLWASETEGVDYTATAEDVLGYMTETLWDEEAGTFATGEGDSTYTVTARDAGDIVGGANAADEVLGMGGVEDIYASFVNNTLRRGRLQRAERPATRNESFEHTLPLPQDAGGEFGQAAVYNTEVEYDTEADDWTVTDDGFTTGDALYLSNQSIWISQWGGDFYEGRGVPGTNDEPPSA